MSTIINPYIVQPSGPQFVAAAFGSFNSPSVSILPPAGAQVGDRVVLMMANAGSNQFINLTNRGFTLVTAGSTGAGYSADIVHKVLESGDMAGWGWTPGPTGIYGIVAYRNVTGVANKGLEMHSADGDVTGLNAGFTKDANSKKVLTMLTALSNPGTITGPSGHTVRASGTLGRITDQDSADYVDDADITNSISNNVQWGWIVIELT